MHCLQFPAGLTIGYLSGIVNAIWSEMEREVRSATTRNRAAEKRRYKQQIDGTKDPYSIMGIVTAWDRGGEYTGRNYYTDIHENTFAQNEWGTGLA